ncbi:hypothetical protein SLT36_30315 (plasmid) [Aminobacter sp. BA135]|uniref:hypothetical protein n=1 Tax=Aminobacter sp. BA135 TaxID=537596 RepID=UPI003D79C629
MDLYEKLLNTAVYWEQGAAATRNASLPRLPFQPVPAMRALRLGEPFTSRAKLSDFPLDQAEALLDLFTRIEGKHILLSKCPLGEELDEVALIEFGEEDAFLDLREDLLHIVDIGGDEMLYQRHVARIFDQPIDDDLEDIGVQLHRLCVESYVARQHVGNGEVAIITLLRIDDRDQADTGQELQILHRNQDAVIDERCVEHDDASLAVAIRLRFEELAPGRVRFLREDVLGLNVAKADTLVELALDRNPFAAVAGQMADDVARLIPTNRTGPVAGQLDPVSDLLATEKLGQEVGDVVSASTPLTADR